MSIIGRLFCKLNKHDPEVITRIETGTLAEPNGSPSREVQIRIILTRCKRCDHTLGLSPCGIVHDSKFAEVE